MPSTSTNTGSVVWTRQPPHDSTTSPVCSATQAAPAAPSAINNRNRMIRIIEIPIAPVWRAQPWRRPRIDGMRPARRRARRPCSSQACAAARSAGSSVFNSRRASLKSLRSAAAVTRATTAPRSLPTVSVRSILTSLAAPACRRSTMPVPVVALFCCAAGDSFGTSASNSRAQPVGVRHALRPQTDRAASRHPDWAPAPWPRRAPPDRDRRSGPAHRAARPPPGGAAACRRQAWRRPWYRQACCLAARSRRPASASGSRSSRCAHRSRRDPATRCRRRAARISPR